MKQLETTRTFDKELAKAGLTPALIDILHSLLTGEPLPQKYQDHQLKGKLKDFRECHVKPDLLLMYKIQDNTVQLVRLNSHSELFK